MTQLLLILLIFFYTYGFFQEAKIFKPDLVKKAIEAIQTATSLAGMMFNYR